jgi:hypothetical protein
MTERYDIHLIKLKMVRAFEKGSKQTSPVQLSNLKEKQQLPKNKKLSHIYTNLDRAPKGEKPRTRSWASRPKNPFRSPYVQSENQVSISLHGRRVCARGGPSPDEIALSQ